MASPELQIVNELIKSIDMTSGSVDERRAAIESVAGPPPEGTTVEPVDAGGVPCEWVIADGVESGRVILYVHGGGYVIGSLDTHRPLVARLSAAAHARVLNVDYRLAPEHPHPAAVDDAVGGIPVARRAGSATRVHRRRGRLRRRRAHAGDIARASRRAATRCRLPRSRSRRGPTSKAPASR